MQALSESRNKSEARAEVDRIDKIEQQSSTETAKAILPGINHYADILEGKIQVSPAERKKEAEELRRLADIANTQSSKVESIALIVAYTTAKTWRTLSDVLRTDADDMNIFSKIKPGERAASAEFHRKVAAVLQRHTDEGFKHCSSLEYDLRPAGGLFAGPAPPEPDKYQRYVSEHPEVCADRTAAQCAELPTLMKQACDGLGGGTDLGVK